MIDIILIILKVLVFIVVLFVFGWLIIEKFLREKSLVFKISGSFLLGFSFYTFLLNSLSHFIAIEISFYLTILLFVIFIVLNSQLLIKQIKKLRAFDLRKCFNPVFIIAIVLFLSILWIGLGFYHEDLLLTHTPTVATMAEGNFPISNPAYPVVRLNYHHAPELLTAAIYKITGLPIWLTYNFLFAFFTSLIFVFGFLLGRQLTKKFKTAYWGSLIMMFAGGLYFIHFFSGLKPLYTKFILKQNIEAPFAFLSSVLGGDYVNEPLIHAAGNHGLAIAWGFALVLAIFYLFLRFFTKENKKWFSYVVIISIVLGFLALSSEVLFVVAAFVFGVYLLLTLILKKLTTKQRLIGLFLILFISGAIAIFQGGVFSRFLAFDFNNNSGWTFRLSDKITFGFSRPVSLFSAAMLEGFGLSIILLPFALFYWRKNRNILLLLLLPVLILFSTPFIAEYVNVGGWGLPKRFFTFTLAFLGLFTGLYLGDLLGKYPTKRIIIYFLILLVTLSGLVYYCFDFFYPAVSAYRHNYSMIAVPPPPSQAEQEAYDWIKQNTGIKDTFLVKRGAPDFLVYKDQHGEEDGYWFIKNNFDFVTYSGRMIIDNPWCEEPGWCDSLGPISLESVSNELARLERVKQTCDADILQQLGVNFIYIEANHFVDFEQKCLQDNDLELKFETKEKDEFVRIYKIIN